MTVEQFMDKLSVMSPDKRVFIKSTSDWGGLAGWLQEATIDKDEEGNVVVKLILD